MKCKKGLKEIFVNIIRENPKSVNVGPIVSTKTSDFNFQKFPVAYHTHLHTKSQICVSGTNSKLKSVRLQNASPSERDM